MWQFSRKSDKRKFDPLFKTLLIKRGKNEDVNEKKKNAEISLFFKFSIPKLGYMEISMKV